MHLRIRFSKKNSIKADMLVDGGTIHLRGTCTEDERGWKTREKVTTNGGERVGRTRSEKSSHSHWFGQVSTSTHFMTSGDHTIIVRCELNHAPPTCIHKQIKAVMIKGYLVFAATRSRGPLNIGLGRNSSVPGFVLRAATYTYRSSSC